MRRREKDREKDRLRVHSVIFLLLFLLLWVVVVVVVAVVYLLSLEYICMIGRRARGLHATPKGWAISYPISHSLVFQFLMSKLIIFSRTPQLFNFFSKESFYYYDSFKKFWFYFCRCCCSSSSSYQLIKYFLFFFVTFCRWRWMRIASCQQPAKPLSSSWCANRTRLVRVAISTRLFRSTVKRSLSILAITSYSQTGRPLSSSWVNLPEPYKMHRELSSSTPNGLK